MVHLQKQKLWAHKRLFAVTLRPPVGGRARAEREEKSYLSDYELLQQDYPKARLFAVNPLKSGGFRRNQSHDFNFQGRIFPIRDSQCWKHTGFEIVAEFYDAAVSGADPVHERKGFGEMLERIAGNGVRVILVEAASRFARDILVQETGHRFLKARGKACAAKSVSAMLAS
jgi:hypothetical protein